MIGYHILAEFARSYISPIPEPRHIQPASVDLMLSPDFVEFDPRDTRSIDPMQDNSARGNRSDFDPDLHEAISLQPKQFVLAATVEEVTMPVTYAGRVEGKSSLARLGLIVHTTAGFIDPGFKGRITLELFNCMDVPILLRPGMPICQLSVFNITGWVGASYGQLPNRTMGYTGKYGGRDAPQQSRYHLNFQEEES